MTMANEPKVSGAHKAAVNLRNAIASCASRHVHGPTIAEIVDIIEAACSQPVAPGRSVYQLFKHKPDCTWAMPLPTGAGYLGCDCGLDYALLELEDFELAAPPAVSTPRCPKCQGLVEFASAKGVGFQIVLCVDCRTEFPADTLDQCAQFFQPVSQPSPAITLGGAVYVDNPQFRGYGIAQYDNGGHRRIGVLLENGNTWEYDAATVRTATPDEYHKMPHLIRKLSAQPSPEGGSKP